jgi:phosphoglycolate phosphatase-like HAD superfamily hydrolase
MRIMPSVPRALLLDFGGVLVDVPVRDRAARVTGEVRDRLAAAGVPVPETLDADLAAGLRAYAHFREAMVRLPEPAELTHREFWVGYVAADWPAAARSVVAERASELCYVLGRLDDDVPLRPGIPELLAEAVKRGIGLAIVSNTLCGAPLRDFVAKAGFGELFAVQLYSDEAGIRKPHPGLVRRALDVLGVPAERAWFVGDTWSRDVRCGRRAGVGTTVLLRSSRTGTETAPPGLTPDLVVADPVELHAALVGATP